MQLTTISRRTFLKQAAGVGIALKCGMLFADSATEPVFVRTHLGKLRGTRAEGVKLFRGVPFAEPPLGALRFRPPVTKKPWSGERDATSFAAAAMQPGDSHTRQSEDCLYLNIWAPEGKGPFPVYVWIHGGGFTGGRSFDPTFDGAEFARAGIVCVTVAYRLGIFGFLDVEPLLGADYRGSANNALRDLMASLQWVQENIADFGGDPSQVTVGGESAGAKLTDILMGVPSARNLFHQMTSESGGAERVWSREDSAKVSNGFAEQWKKNSGSKLSQITSAAASELIEAQRTFMASWPQHFPLRAEIDGNLLPRLPVESIAQGSSQGKRLLIGTNKDESAMFVGPHPTKDATANDLGNMPLSKFDDVYRRYKELYPEMNPEQLRIRSLTAEEYWIPSTRVTDAHVKGGGKAWSYRVDFAENSGRLQHYAYHGLDLALVWDKPHANVENVSAETSLASQVHAAWVAFIQGLPPKAGGLPLWPEYQSNTRATMILDAKSRVEDKPLEAELRLWDGVL